MFYCNFFALEYAIMGVQVNEDSLKLNVTHKLLVYADEVNMLGGRVHTVKENAEALVVGSKERRLEVNADKTKYMVMSRDQNTRRNHNTRLIIFRLKSGTVQIFGNSLNE
jgi:hypothetical protein